MARKSTWLMLWVVAISIALAGGCKRSNQSDSDGNPSEVRLGYFANLTHAQAVLGVSSGEFEKAIAPAKLATKVFNAGPSLVEALFAGEIDIGYVGPGPAINAYARSNGRGIRVVAGAAANGVLIVARKDSGIKTLADLKGRKIATPQYGNTQDISAKHFLVTRFGQGDVKNVLAVPNAEQFAMMSRGQIDAAWAPEPWGSRLVIEAGAVPVGQEKELWEGNDFTLTVVVTTPEFLRDHANVVEKILRVHHGWTQKLQEKPEAYAAPLGDALANLNQGKRLPPGVVEAAIKNVKFTDDPLNSTLKAMARWSSELGFSKEVKDLDRLVDLSALKRL